MQEIKLSVQELTDLEGFLQRGLESLGASKDLSPNQLVNLLDTAVDNWQDQEQQRRQPTDNAQINDTALTWGVVWGYQFIRQFRWEWTKFDYQGQHYVVVASPKRDWAIHPWYFVTQCLKDPQLDCTIMLAFTMVQEHKVPDGDPNTFEDLMPAVTRIVPKPGRRMSTRLM